MGSWRLLKAHACACLTLQPERTDPEQMRRSVAPLPGSGKEGGDAEAAAAAALARKRAQQRLAEEAGLIKAMPGLYGTLGGASAISAIVELALSKAAGNWKAKRFVEGANVQQLEDWLAAAFGGPVPYTGPDVATLHGHLVMHKNLTPASLDLAVQQVTGAMRELGMPEEHVAAAAAALEEQRRRL